MNTQENDESECSSLRSERNVWIAGFDRLIVLGQAVGLITIALAAIAGVAHTIWSMVSKFSFEVGELLLIFLYIEILSMVKGVRLGTRELPLHMPIALAIVAVARYLMVDVEHVEPLFMAYTSAAILLLVIALRVIRNHDRPKE